MTKHRPGFWVFRYSTEIRNKKNKKIEIKHFLKSIKTLLFAIEIRRKQNNYQPRKPGCLLPLPSQKSLACEVEKLPSITPQARVSIVMYIIVKICHTIYNFKMKLTCLF